MSLNSIVTTTLAKGNIKTLTIVLQNHKPKSKLRLRKSGNEEIGGRCVAALVTDLQSPFLSLRNLKINGIEFQMYILESVMDHCFTMKYNLFL